jgi:hypothetical protein
MPYVITTNGSEGFRVAATGLHPDEEAMVADFGTLAKAQAFVATMDEIDAGRTDSMAPKEPG